MERPEPGLVRWSPNPAYDSFLHINLQHRLVQIYEPTGYAQRGRFDYKKLSKHEDLPMPTSYDWAPTIPGLVAVGSSTGVVNLLRVEDNSNAYLELGLKMSRTCQAVAFSVSGLLAVGLDRVRNDHSLYIWDVNRLSGLDSTTTGFPPNMASFTEPASRLEPSVSVSSVKFFEDNPQTLVVGVRGQGLRIHDLRDPGASSILFPTKCNNNLAIDYADQNYFASSALDHPGVMVWDRRATARSVASHSYLEAVDVDGIPWGGALRLDRVLDVESDPALVDSKNSMIRSLRYCRDHSGMLAVLSRTGQLRILSTKPEFTSPSKEVEGGPELLQVRESHEMDYRYLDPGRKNDRIVSFDWVALGSSVQRPRLLVLRANGAFEMLEKPSFTSTYPFKLIPWQAPHRGLEGDDPYHSTIHLEPSQMRDLLGPLITEDALSDVPVFGPKKAHVGAIVQQSLEPELPDDNLIVDREANEKPVPEIYKAASSISEKLRILRKHAWETLHHQSADGVDQAGGAPLNPDDMVDTFSALSVDIDGPPSSRARHEKLLTLSTETDGFPKESQVALDHVMLLRAKERYLFDYELNKKIVADDPWLHYVWSWIAGAENAAVDGNMESQRIEYGAGGTGGTGGALSLDLSYMGVQSIWMDDVDRDSPRFAEVAVLPDGAGWERSIHSICKRRKLPKFDGVETKRPHHRQLCVDIANWGGQSDGEFGPYVQNGGGMDEKSIKHTRATVQALYRGDIKRAIQILKKASTESPELLFVSLAIQLMGRGERDLAKEQLDFDEAVASKTDPYLRAISSLIATGDWATIANQRSLPLRDRVVVAVRHLNDTQLTRWLRDEVTMAVETGDIEGIVLTGITNRMVDILAKYVERFHDVQTATLIMSICAPRYIDDFRCRAWRNAYRAYLQRHKAFYQRTKFEAESTKKSKSRDGRPTIKAPSRQISLRCVYCDAQIALSRPGAGGSGGGIGLLPPSTSALERENPLTAKMAGAGISCPTCKRFLPRCVVCLEVVGMPRSDRPELAADPETRLAARFPTFCLKCDHVLHLDHARQWFARHVECPVPECRCRCNFRANPELSYP